MSGKLWFIFVFQVIFPWQNVTALFKLTNARCESLNKSLAVVNECRLRAIKRDHAVMNMNITLLRPMYEIVLNGVILKKYNGYKPFIFNYTHDACEFMKKRNNPAASIIYKLYKDFSNINHSCPFVGDQILKGFYPKTDLINLPLPNGEYALVLTWYFHKIKLLIINVHFTLGDYKLGCELGSLNKHCT